MVCRAGGGAAFSRSSAARDLELASAVFEPSSEGGCISRLEELPGVLSEGETLEGAKVNLLAALSIYMRPQFRMRLVIVIPASCRPS